MSESELQREIQKAVTPLGVRLFRHNVAEGWMGDAQITHHEGGISVYIPHARPLHAGLVVGGSDLLGWNSRGLFTAVEVKSKLGRLTEQQSNFIDQVRASGGIALCARSVADVLEVLKRQV